MCETRGTPEATLRQPRWGVLYAATLPQIAALGAVEVVQSPPAVRVALRCLLALGVFVAMALWLRANRPAFDLRNWCDCAGARMTIRVIESRRPQPISVPCAHPATIPEEVEVGAEYEVAAR
jgi:hypothetical protein